MNLYLPRRYRRQLLFPPGLLALAGLLWLGCVAIGSWQEKLSRKSVVPLTMPALNLQDDFPTNPPNPIKWSRQRLDSFRRWRDVTLNGHQGIDATSKQQLLAAVAGLEANSANDDGLRVSFSSSATYAEFVLVLDLMSQYNIKKYWFDIVHTPITFYAITVRPVVGEKKNTFPLGQCVRYIELPRFAPPLYHSTSYLLRFDNWVTDLWNPKPPYKAENYPYGPSYIEPIFSPEREYLWKVFQQWREILISFHQPQWGIPFALLIYLTASNCLQLKRHLQHR
ncbi:hypothetical protein [Hymenobacter sedentarius]|uniref:hypothetical protein n=1 Tax=Hymenobacter sedentarius TaxID=1411621 RepID=UPI000B16D7D5|nr:hypothetical protein [Hymenobacter sedentarius]